MAAHAIITTYLLFTLHLCFFYTLFLPLTNSFLEPLDKCFCRYIIEPDYSHAIYSCAYGQYHKHIHTVHCNTQSSFMLQLLICTVYTFVVANQNLISIAIPTAYTNELKITLSIHYLTLIPPNINYSLLQICNTIYYQEKIICYLLLLMDQL